MVTFSTVVMVILILALVGLSAYWLKNNGAEAYAWLTALAQGGAASLGRRTWAATDTDNEEGEEDVSSANSAHGLTGRSSVSAKPAGASSARSYLGLGTSRAGKATSNSAEADGVELEDYVYSPPSINSSSSIGTSRSSASRTHAEPIDFRGDAEHTSGASSVSNVLGGAASKLLSAASTALTTAASNVPGIDAWSPMHKQSAGRQQRGGGGGEEPELHL